MEHRIETARAVNSAIVKRSGGYDFKMEVADDYPESVRITIIDAMDKPRASMVVKLGTLFKMVIGFMGEHKSEPG